MCVVVQYQWSYIAAPPAEPANQIFLIRLMSVDGLTQLGAVTPYPYYDDGYGQGIVALYFDAASAPTWGLSYIVQLTGNPALYPTPPTVNRQLLSGDYSGFADQQGNQAAMASLVVDILEVLESDWATALLASSAAGIITTETGEEYLVNAIPGSPGMVPSLFYVSSSSPVYDRTTWTNAQATIYEDRFAGSWVGHAVNSAGGLVGIDGRLAATLLFTLIPFLVMMWLCQKWFARTQPALIGGVSLLGCGTLLGMLDMFWIAMMTIGWAMYLGYVLFLKAA